MITIQNGGNSGTDYSKIDIDTYQPGILALYFTGKHETPAGVRSDSVVMSVSTVRDLRDRLNGWLKKHENKSLLTGDLEEEG